MKSNLATETNSESSLFWGSQWNTVNRERSRAPDETLKNCEGKVRQNEDWEGKIRCAQWEGSKSPVTEGEYK